MDVPFVPHIVPGNKEPTRTLFIGNLSFFSTERDIIELLQQFGTRVFHCEIKRGKSGDHLQYGFAETDIYTSENTVNRMNGIKFMGRCLKINFADTPGHNGNPLDTSTWQKVHFSFITEVMKTRTDEVYFNEIFGRFGAIADVTIKQYSQVGTKQAGYGFAYFYDSRGSENAVFALKDQTYADCRFDCTLARPDCDIGNKRRQRMEKESGSSVQVSSYPLPLPPPPPKPPRVNVPVAVSSLPTAPTLPSPLIALKKEIVTAADGALISSVNNNTNTDGVQALEQATEALKVSSVEEQDKEGNNKNGEGEGEEGVEAALSGRAAARGMRLSAPPFVVSSMQTTAYIPTVEDAAAAAVDSSTGGYVQMPNNKGTTFFFPSDPNEGVIMPVIPPGTQLLPRSQQAGYHRVFQPAARDQDNNDAVLVQQAMEAAAAYQQQQQQSRHSIESAVAPSDSQQYQPQPAVALLPSAVRYKGETYYPPPAAAAAQYSAATPSAAMPYGAQQPSSPRAPYEAGLSGALGRVGGVGSRPPSSSEYQNAYALPVSSTASHQHQQQDAYYSHEQQDQTAFQYQYHSAGRVKTIAAAYNNNSNSSRLPIQVAAAPAPARIRSQPLPGHHVNVNDNPFRRGQQQLLMPTTDYDYSLAAVPYPYSSQSGGSGGGRRVVSEPSPAAVAAYSSKSGRPQQQRSQRSQYDNHHYYGEVSNESAYTNTRMHTFKPAGSHAPPPASAYRSINNNNNNTIYHNNSQYAHTRSLDSYEGDHNLCRAGGSHNTSGYSLTGSNIDDVTAAIALASSSSSHHHDYHRPQVLSPSARTLPLYSSDDVSNIPLRPARRQQPPSQLSVVDARSPPLPSSADHFNDYTGGRGSSSMLFDLPGLRQEGAASFDILGGGLQGLQLLSSSSTALYPLSSSRPVSNNTIFTHSDSLTTAGYSSRPLSLNDGVDDPVADFSLHSNSHNKRYGINMNSSLQSQQSQQSSQLLGRSFLLEPQQQADSSSALSSTATSRRSSAINDTVVQLSSGGGQQYDPFVVGGIGGGGGGGEWPLDGVSQSGQQGKKAASSSKEQQQSQHQGYHGLW